jgi:hypothetical protein
MSSSITPQSGSSDPQGTISHIKPTTNSAKTSEDYTWKQVVQDGTKKHFELQFRGKDSKLYTLKMNYPNSVNEKLAVTTMLAIADLVKKDSDVAEEIASYLQSGKCIKTFNILSPVIPDHEKIPQEQYGICLVFEGTNANDPPYMYVTDEYGLIKIKNFNTQDINSSTFKSELTADWIYRGNTTNWKNWFRLKAAKVQNCASHLFPARFKTSEQKQQLLSSGGYKEGYIITSSMPGGQGEGYITVNGRRLRIDEYIKSTAEAIKNKTATQVKLQRRTPDPSLPDPSLTIRPLESQQATGTGIITNIGQGSKHA